VPVVNAKQAQAYFRSLGWELQDHAPSKPRWTLIEFDDGIALFSGRCETLNVVWKFWRSYAGYFIGSSAMVDFLVREYLQGDPEKRKAIDAWADGDSPDVYLTKRTLAMWEQADSLQNDESPLPKRWCERMRRLSEDQRASVLDSGAAFKDRLALVQEAGAEDSTMIRKVA